MQKGFGQYRSELVKKDEYIARTRKEGRHGVSKFRRAVGMKTAIKQADPYHNVFGMVLSSIGFAELLRSW